MNQDQRQQAKRFLDIFLRRKKPIIICMLLALFIGLGIYIKTPKIYRSSSLIMYQQKINPTKMSPDMGRFQEIVGTVSQQINSRTSLEGLINQFDLYKDLRSRLPMEDVVAIMRDNHIKIQPDRRGNIFEVSYQGSEPRKVLLVTNALASKFIEENIRVREETVSETSAYIQDELNMSKEALNKKDAAMRDYKLKYYNEMPQQLETNITRLISLQNANQSYQSNLQDLERTKILLQEQVNLRRDFLKDIVNNNENSLPNTDQQGLSKNRQLASLKYDLDVLSTRYTEKHPDVKRLKILIAQLEEDLKSEYKDSNTEPESGYTDIESRDSILVKLLKQINEIQYNIDKLKKEQTETLINIEKYKKWIEAAPVREAEWTDLTRDYEQFSKHYELLVGKNIEAESAEGLERRQKGSQFKIIDPAHFPETPFSPDFMRIMLMALGIGLGTGAAIALGLEFLDTSFRDAHDLEKFLQLPVACSIPVIRTDKEKMAQHFKSALWLSLLVLSLTILGGGIAFLWYKGIIII